MTLIDILKQYNDVKTVLRSKLHPVMEAISDHTGVERLYLSEDGIRISADGTTVYLKFDYHTYGRDESGVFSVPLDCIETDNMELVNSHLADVEVQRQAAGHFQRILDAEKEKRKRREQYLILKREFENDEPF